MYKLFAIMALLAIFGCETTAGQPNFGPPCYRTYPDKTCKSTGCGGGVCGTFCTTKTKCVPCTDVEGTGCWVQNVLIKCKTTCPAGSE